MSENKSYTAGIFRKKGSEKTLVFKMHFKQIEEEVIISCEEPGEPVKKVVGGIAQIKNGEWVLTSELADDLQLSRRWADWNDACLAIVDAVERRPAAVRMHS